MKKLYLEAEAKVLENQVFVFKVLHQWKGQIQQLHTLSNQPKLNLSKWLWGKFWCSFLMQRPCTCEMKRIQFWLICCMTNDHTLYLDTHYYGHKMQTLMRTWISTGILNKFHGGISSMLDIAPLIRFHDSHWIISIVPMNKFYTVHE